MERTGEKAVGPLTLVLKLEHEVFCGQKYT